MKQLLNQIVYYCLLRPLLLLPMLILYLFADFFYLILLTVFPYRKKVIDQSIHNSFPHLSSVEVKQLRRKFYRYFSDILVEGLKNMSLSKNALLSRVEVVNPEIMEELYRKNKSVLLVSGHYNNWEWVISSMNLLFPHQAVGIGMPLTNAYWDEKINARRARFGIVITDYKKVHDDLGKLKNQPIVTLVLGDQSPSNSKKSYWMNFLNQQTAVLFGCELLAHQYNHAVVFYHLERVKRGFYRMHLQLITEEPRNCKWGEITERHTRLLEKVIIDKPQYWLWSHKRWKREIPENLEELKREQKNRFEQKFNVG